MQLVISTASRGKDTDLHALAPRAKRCSGDQPVVPRPRRRSGFGMKAADAVAVCGPMALPLRRTRAVSTRLTRSDPPNGGNMIKTVIGSFDSFDEARQVVRDLKDEGFMESDISIVAS